MSQLIIGDQEGDERMPKKRRCGEADASRQQQQQHLYLVFDDWRSGYSIYKVNLPEFRSCKGEEALTHGGQPLPQVFWRVSLPHGVPINYVTPAFGSKILMIPAGVNETTPIIDVQERSIAFGGGPSLQVCPIYIPVGEDKLFVLALNSSEICLWSPKERNCLLWEELPMHPFDRWHVSSYALQPDGLILVSTKQGDDAATFSFSVEDRVWKKHGQWALPFTGRGHYDPSLELFVGLSEDGYLYGCSMTSTGTADGLCPSPIVKHSKEKVYTRKPSERHVRATLVYIRRGKFCLVECVSIDGVGADQDQVLPRYFYRLMAFSLRYDMKGDLKLKHCRVRRYSLPRQPATDYKVQDPLAFWL